MLGKNTISQSLIDAVNSVDEAWPGTPEYKAKYDDKYKQQQGGGAGVKKGSRYGGSLQKDKPEHDTDEAGKKVKEEVELEEDKDCVTKPEAKGIAKGEVKKHEKKMHGESTAFKDQLIEREMTGSEKKKREKIVLSMKDKSAGFKKKYGKRWKDVMYATATKTAMGEETIVEDPGVTTDMLKGRVNGGNSNSFKNFKVKLEGGIEAAPSEEEVSKTSTSARASIETHDNSDVKPHIDPKLGHPNPFHQKEEVESVEEASDTTTKDKSGKVTSWKHEGDWKKINLKKNPEGKVHNLAGQALKKTKTMAKEETVVEAKDPSMDAGVGSDPQFAQNANTTSSPAMNRVKDMVKKSMTRMKSEMLGKAPGNN
jgi:hypothetical protein